MTRLYLNDRGLYATGPDEYQGYKLPDNHVCGPGCRIGWHVFPPPYHVETCTHCGAVVERFEAPRGITCRTPDGTWVHRDGGQQSCWDAAKRQPRATGAAPAIKAA
jgi:hypothetical protein